MVRIRLHSLHGLLQGLGLGARGGQLGTGPSLTNLEVVIAVAIVVGCPAVLVPVKQG